MSQSPDDGLLTFSIPYYCVALATQKCISKLNVMYRALKSIALLQLGDARRGFRLSLAL